MVPVTESCMRLILLVVVAIVGVGCTSSTAPQAPWPTGPCWVTARVLQDTVEYRVVTLTADAHYHRCPSREALDAIWGAGRYSVKAG